MIGGLYHANKYFHDSTPDVFAQRIADKIWEQNNQAILLSVHNMGLATCFLQETHADTALQLYSFTDSKWKLKPGV